MTLTYCELEQVLPFPVQQRVVRRSASTPAASGQVARRRLQSSHSRHTSRPEIRRWRLSYQLRRRLSTGESGMTEYEAVVEAFKQAGGVALPVLFQPPGEAQQIPVRFVSNTIRFQHRTAGLVGCEFEVEEVV